MPIPATGGWMRSRNPFETVLCVVSLNLLMAAGPCHAFHSGGTGDCGGCHDMHRPAGGSGTGTEGNPYFLIAADAGSTCLACHQATGENRPNGHLVSTADADMPPGTPPV